MKLSLSIANLPLNISAEKLFKLAKKEKLDGVEIHSGIKNLDSISYFSKLSAKYGVPVLSVHYPVWIEKLIIPKRKVFKLADHFNALMVVHPLKKHPLNSRKQMEYFKKLKTLSDNYNVLITIENLSLKSTLQVYKYFSHSENSTTKLDKITSMAKDFNLGITLDTSHLGIPDPSSSPWFKKTFPLLKNVHLSDFSKTKQHLSLGKGNLEVGKFIKQLRRLSYTGIVTIELSPRIFVNEEKYFKEIRDSARFVRKYLAGSDKVL